MDGHVGTPSRLDLLKALGDNTRYAIYLELARSPRPLATADVAESLGLHANTVRPHLERMREVGLLTIETEARGGVGRPQHRYALAPDAPSLGLEPPAMPLMAEMLVGVAAAAGAAPEEAAAIGRLQGRAAAALVRPTMALRFEQRAGSAVGGGGATDVGGREVGEVLDGAADRCHEYLTEVDLGRSVLRDVDLGDVDRSRAGLSVAPSGEDVRAGAQDGAVVGPTAVLSGADLDGADAWEGGGRTATSSGGGARTFDRRTADRAGDDVVAGAPSEYADDAVADALRTDAARPSAHRSDAVRTFDVRTIDAEGHGGVAALGADEEDDVGDDAGACLAALVDDLARLGFDPAVAHDDAGASIAFTHCPFAELAAAHPEIVCHLHRGMVEGFVEVVGGLDVTTFGTLVDRRPCRVELVRTTATSGESERTPHASPE